MSITSQSSFIPVCCFIYHSLLSFDFILTLFPAPPPGTIHPIAESVSACTLVGPRRLGLKTTILQHIPSFPQRETASQNMNA